ncbi:MAG: sulfate adenylyltransferase [Flavobacteriales bacterium]|nr:sulfate adenylyltransferase [Flavobacteriales bacterium]
MDLVRFITAGSVDDGKSTLIGRLLYDSKSIFEDQLDHVAKASEKKGLAHVDLALLTDGLRDEREQGITIDVAYRYFATPKRKFIIADCPGHIQYTRNMVTGASTANVALILVDARNGLTEQTHRHSFIASLLQIPHLIICINKMDLVNYDQQVYDQIVEDYRNFAAKLEVRDIQFVPVSALHGDNIVEPSTNMDWYRGSTLLYTLENCHVSSDQNMVDCRFPVQTVLRPKSDEFHDYRGYAGRVAGGIFKPGDEVVALPSGFTSKISRISLAGKEVEEAFPPMSVAIELEDDIDVSRGDMLARLNNQPTAAQDIDAIICWLSDKPMVPRTKFIIKHTSREARAMVKEVNYTLDINTLHRQEGEQDIQMNDIARVQLRTTSPLFIDPYNKNRTTGAFILIDPVSLNTVAAGVIKS